MFEHIMEMSRKTAYTRTKLPAEKISAGEVTGVDTGEDTGEVRRDIVRIATINITSKSRNSLYPSQKVREG